MSSLPLWTPAAERTERSNMTAFRRYVNQTFSTNLADYDALYDWSVQETSDFWQAVWDFTGTVCSQPAERVMSEPRMPGTEWFAGAKLNFAQNLLRYSDDREALVWVCENGERESVTSAQLRARVAKLAAWMRSVGVTCGDRVAGFVPNRIESIVAMLAATSIGAIWSSCSPDFGFKGVMDRFGQIRPKVLITADGYRYNGKVHDSLARVAEVVQAIDSIEQVVVFAMVSDQPDLSSLGGKGVAWSAAIDNDASDVVFEQLPFDHPLYIMYSSGTTGVPKCIVHGAGGTLLQHAKELVLHTDLIRDDSIFYFTTCGWMMWNWLVSSLLTGAKIVLYDGSPAYPDARVLWRMAANEGVTVFGTSPKFITLCKKAGISPMSEHSLKVRTLMSTGAPLSAENFEWLGEHMHGVQVASICGGTDIISCFMLGVPTEPVYAGEIQKRGLGMAVEAWAGERAPVLGQKAELVCVKPFVSMPVSFWNDPGGAKYHSAYFDVFPGVWRHGDFIEITDRGGVIVYGRSDATLNPGGVRIGTAEIYRVVEEFDEVVDSIVVGQPHKDDVRVVLFVVLRPGLQLQPELIAAIKKRIRAEATPRHVPALIVAAPDVPRTISGKKVEIAVTRVLQGETIHNRDAMANPEAIDWYAAIDLG